MPREIYPRLSPCPSEGFLFVFQFEMTLTIFLVRSNVCELFLISLGKHYSEEAYNASPETHHNSEHLTFNYGIKSK